MIESRRRAGARTNHRDRSSHAHRVNRVAKTTVRVSGNLDGPSAITPAGQSVFFDLFEPDEAIELAMRSVLLQHLQQWLMKSGLRRAVAAKSLRVDGARIEDVRHGRIGRIRLVMLIRMAVRAGFTPTLRVVGPTKAHGCRHRHIAAGRA